MVNMKSAMAYLEPWQPKRQATINRYCIEGRIPCTRKGEMWFIEEPYLQQAVEWKKTAVTTDELLLSAEGFAELSEKDRELCSRNVTRQTAECLAEENEYSLLFTGRFIAPEHVDEVKQLISDIVKEYADRAKMLPVAEAAKRLDLSVYKVKKLIDEGTIKAEVVKNDWYVPETGIQEYIDANSKYIGLNQIVSEIISEVKTTFNIENRIDRAMLNNAIRNSKLAPLVIEWKDAGLHGDRRNSLYIPVESREFFEEFIRRYLKMHGSAEERLRMLEADVYWETHPKTWEALQKFSEGKVPNGMVALMETIMETLDSEVMDADDEAIDKMIDYSVEAMLEIYQLYTASFLKFVQKKHKCKYTIVADYRTGKVHKRTVNSTPYSVNDYYIFSCMNFDDEFIREQRLVEKAVNDGRMAFLWFRNCMLYTSMWRDSDHVDQIPVVPLKISRQKLKEKLLSGEFTEQDADELTIRLEMAIQEKKLKPHKTKKEFLRVHFSESLRPVIGLAYACCLVHADSECIKGMKLTSGVYRNFYGEDYVRLFGAKPFMNRRANKSYADALMTITERTNDNEHKVRGYIIAGYARGHSMKSGQIPTATHNYLQYKLDGLSDDEVIKTLLDMGTCSFVVDMLLDAVYGEAYRQLPFEHQAELVKEAGLTAHTADQLSSAVMKSYRRSKKLAEELLASYPTIEGQKKACKDAMLNIIEGKAAAKDEGISCLNLAFLRPCSEQRCEHCPGCENAILHKGAFFTVFNVLDDAYKKMRNAKTEATAKKYQALIDNRYLPAALELLRFCKEKYGMDTTEAKNRIYRLITNDERRLD